MRGASRPDLEALKPCATDIVISDGNNVCTQIDVLRTGIFQPALLPERFFLMRVGGGCQRCARPDPLPDNYLAVGN